MTKQSSDSKASIPKKSVPSAPVKKIVVPSPSKRSNATGKDNAPEKKSRGTGAKEIK